MARAKAEERRSVAIAREQEMKAATADNRARLLQAEALVPKSIGDAFRAGRVAALGPANGKA
ncbi:MAG: flotillin-like FloA family protein [bacterium]